MIPRGGLRIPCGTLLAAVSPVEEWEWNWTMYLARKAWNAEHGPWSVWVPEIVGAAYDKRAWRRFCTANVMGILRSRARYWADVRACWQVFTANTKGQDHGNR